MSAVQAIVAGLIIAGLGAGATALLPRVSIRTGARLLHVGQALVAVAMLVQVTASDDWLSRLFAGLALGWLVGDMLAYPLRARLARAESDRDEALTALARRDGLVRSCSEAWKALGDARR